MIEIIVGLVDYLKADAGVAALVGTRVYGVEIPPTQVDSMPQKAVMVRPEGGNPRPGTLPIARPRYDLWSTAETFLEAIEVDAAVFDALETLRREDISNVFLHCVLPAHGHRATREPTTGWRAVVRAATVIADERSTA